MRKSLITGSLTGVIFAVGFTLSPPAFSQGTGSHDTPAAHLSQVPEPGNAPTSTVTKQHVDGGDCCAPNTVFTERPGVFAQPGPQPVPAQR
jgi:hypothetical protein